jgi:hypothetical protein
VTLLGSRQSPGAATGVMVELQLTLALRDAARFANQLRCCTVSV